MGNPPIRIHVDSSVEHFINDNQPQGKEHAYILRLDQKTHTLEAVDCKELSVWLGRLISSTWLGQKLFSTTYNLKQIVDLLDDAHVKQNADWGAKFIQKLNHRIDAYNMVNPDDFPVAPLLYNVGHLGQGIVMFSSKHLPTPAQGTDAVIEVEEQI